MPTNKVVAAVVYCTDEATATIVRALILNALVGVAGIAVPTVAVMDKEFFESKKFDDRIEGELA